MHKVYTVHTKEYTVCKSVYLVHTKCTLCTNVHQSVHKVCTVHIKRILCTQRIQNVHRRGHFARAQNGRACGRFCARAKSYFWPKLTKISPTCTAFYGAQKGLACKRKMTIKWIKPPTYSITIFQNPRTLQKLAKMFWKLVSQIFCKMHVFNMLKTSLLPSPKMPDFQTETHQFSKVGGSRPVLKGPIFNDQLVRV